MTITASTHRPLDFDPLSPDFQRHDPFDTYRRLRDESPVYYSEKWGWWALSRFEDVRDAVLDPTTYLSFEGIDIDDTAKDQSGPGFLPDLDNPRHDQIRRVIQPYFLPRRIGEQKHNVQRVVRGLVDGWRTRGTVDLASELSWPMPNEVFFRVLGLPYSANEGADEGAANLMRWVHELKDRAPNDVRLTPVAKAATRGIQDYFVELLNDRRRHPRNDLVSYLVQADIDGTPFADEDIEPASEIMGLMMVLFLGGVESTAGLTSTTFKLLAENPDQRDLLLADPTLIPDAVEETLRFATPLQLVGRTTSREVELHGVTIPAGGRVVLLYGAANRDERQYPDPDRFDISRPRARHLGFSEGMHGCLGAPLARLEVQTALEEALPVLGRYELAGEPQRYATTPNMYVWSSLPLRFEVDPAEARRTSVPADSPVGATDSFPVTTTEPVIEARVQAMELVSEGVVALTLTAADGQALPPWTPGAHVDLMLGEAPTRQYSLCGRTDDTSCYRIGVLRDDRGGGGSRYVHERLRTGDSVRVRGPRNHFGLDPSPRYVFVAGGIGITPMLPMIAAAEAAGATWELLYGGRRRGSMAFLDELTPYGDRVTVWPQDEVGLLNLEAVLGTPREDTLVYACGPEPLLAAVEQQCRTWPSGALHLERFAPKPMGEPVRAEAFEVVLDRSGLTLTVPPERSILSLVEEAGVGVVSSCAEGTCGTCETRVLAGLPDHRDSVLREEEKAGNACMMICVSRSCGDRLVLDL
jgi:cytochrome P450/ferredoxin-NADP reductase